MENSPIDLVAAVEARAAFEIDARQLATATAFLRKRVAHKLGRFENSPDAIASASVRITARPCGAIVLEASRTGYVGATITLQGADVSTPGAFVASADTLDGAAQKLAKAGKGAVARIEDGPGRASVSAGRARFGLVSRAADTLHEHPTAGEGATLSAEFALPLAQFAADLKALAPAIGSEERRTALHQVALHRRELAGQERLLMLATDGSNAVAASRPIPAGAEALPDCGIPAEAVAALIDLAKLGGGEHAALRLEQSPSGDLMTVTTRCASLAFFGAVETLPDIMRAIEGAMGEIDAQEPLFPDLLPGAPTGAMERLAKAAPGAVEWQHSGQVMLGSCADPDLFLCAMRCEGDATGRKGESYQGPAIERYRQPSLPGATGEIVGPDGITYPVPFKDNGAAIGFSASEVRALIGESCFETIAVPLPAGHPARTAFPVGTAYVARWLFEEGDSRLLCVKPDGRCYDYSAGGEPVYLSRTEVESLLSAGPETDAAAVGDVATETTVPSPVEDAPANSMATILSRLDALEAALATLPAQSVANPSVGMPDKRTPAHERAVRRAWAERRDRREAERCRDALRADCHENERSALEAESQLRHARQQLEDTRTNMEKWTEEARKGRRSTSRRRMAVQRARRMLIAAHKRANAQGAQIDALQSRADSAATAAREALSEASAARQGQKSGQAELARLRADMADPAQPERASDIVQLRRERDEARNACAALQQRCERAEASRDTLAAAVDSMASRMAVAEAAVRRLQAA